MLTVSLIWAKPEVNNCFSIVFRGEYEELEENWAKHEKQMRLSLAITPRNPIITHNSYIRLSKLYEWWILPTFVGKYK